LVRVRERPPRRSDRRLEGAGCKTLALDVEDERSMAAAVAEIERAEGAIGVLINNAGYSQSGAIESVPMEKVRRQFETNVFGLVRLTQLVLPGMRKQRWGKIVNISSMGGKLTFPAAASITRPSTRWRRSATRCASRCAASASTS
jgi:NAD(P)-dependent dehydrogenase (short-subunit alcohol dehydrogenase family)